MENENDLKKFAEQAEGQEPAIETPTTLKAEKLMPWAKKEGDVALGNSIGWAQVNLKDLPTQGLFYPEGTEIAIRSATGAEIRHWSSLDEDNLSALDDMLNYVIERCATIKFPDQASTWKDFKEIDRFYVLLSIRERTFVKGENVLQVKVSESNKIDVNKDMIDYINFDPRLMQYYNDQSRNIVLNFKEGTKLEINLPSVGVTNWLKNYIIRKSQKQEPFDEDFLNFAPFVINNWRGLTDATYEKIIMDSQKWTNAEISMLTEIKKIFTETVDPVIKYKDEQGGERTIPLNFQGGIKSIFLISDPFSQLT